MAKRPSRTMTMKIDFTTDDVVWRPSDSARALHRQALGAGDDADHEGHEGRLDEPNHECVGGDRFLQPRQEYRPGSCPP